MLVGNMYLTTELLTLASAAHALTCAAVRTDISVDRFAFPATASRLYTSNETVASQTRTVSLSILLCTFNDTGHAILMCLLQIAVSLAKCVWRHCLAAYYCTKTLREHSKNRAKRTLMGCKAHRRAKQDIHGATFAMRNHTCMTLTASSTVKPSTTFISSLTTYSRLQTITQEFKNVS